MGIRKAAEVAREEQSRLVGRGVERIAAKTAAAEQELKRSKLEAESIRIRADAEAYAKRANVSANNSLDAKLNAWVEANKAWANSSTAPPVVFNGAPGGAKGGAENLYPLLMMKMLSEQVGVNPRPER